MHHITIGQKFHRLTALEPRPSKDALRMWLWRCECGQEKELAASKVIRGFSKSCGCLRTELLLARGITHGASKTPEYRIWIGMKKRCHQPSDTSYHRYGGRGIAVCDRWRHSFEHFMADMGRRPSLKHSIDRIDNDGPYSPENCRWATWLQQARNKHNNHLITFRGRTLPLGTWANELGLDRLLVRQRLLKLGWSPERAFTERSQAGSHSIRQMAKAHGLKRTTVSARLHKGWSLKCALNTPV